MLKIEDAMKALKDGVKELTNSDTWRRYLQVQARFHHYSFFNVLMILMQRPTASHVAGFRAWQGMGRHVKRGEKGIAILAPRFRTQKDEEGKETQTLCGFITVPVFDIEQTEGEALPEVAQLLTGEAMAEILRDALAACPVKVSFKDIEGGANGYFSPTETAIAIHSDRDVNQQLKTLLHERAHSLNYELAQADGEVFAEAVAFIVSNHFGFDTSQYTFGYIAHWAAGNAERIDAVASEIQKAAATIIDEIESQRAKKNATPAAAN